MPMIDLYAAKGTFQDPHQLAAELARMLMIIEGVPDIPMFRQNTAGFIHEMDPRPSPTLMVTAGMFEFRY